MYYIQLSNSVSDSATIKSFYEQMKLGSEMRRLDYLLMSLIGLQTKMCEDSEVYAKMGEAIKLLRSKRNIMSC